MVTNFNVVNWANHEIKILVQKPAIRYMYIYMYKIIDVRIAIWYIYIATIYVRLNLVIFSSLFTCYIDYFSLFLTVQCINTQLQ